METNNILYIPIQINGGSAVPSELLERELFVLDNGTLYVGKKVGNNVVVSEVIGKVADGATIKNAVLESPTMNNMKVQVYSSAEAIPNPQQGAVYFIDEGNF